MCVLLLFSILLNQNLLLRDDDPSCSPFASLLALSCGVSISDRMLPNKEDSIISIRKAGRQRSLLTLLTYATKTPIGSSSTFISPVAAAAAAEANSPRNKVFAVRPITSWIDKLAQLHGSPTSTSASGNADPNKKYSKREPVLKTMQHSYTEIILPFATDKALLEEYISFGGTVRWRNITLSAVRIWLWVID
jgi:hypothetical protein